MNPAEPTAPRRGVLLVNLGTPEAPTAPAIRRFLAEFLSDRRVVELPRLLWWPVLYGAILPLRARRLAHAYASIWTAQGSPLLAISRLQEAALQAQLGDVTVKLAMTYGRPSIAEALDQFEHEQIRRIAVLPLYPQYSATTTAAVLDAVFRHLRGRRRLPELHTVADYHDDPAYIGALAASVQAHWAAHGRGDHLLVSFHSIPQRCVDLGDPYLDQCRRTAQLLAAALQLGEQEWTLAFQSRVGRAAWLQPYTDLVIPQLARDGKRTLDVVCPGFAADCLETLEEVALRYAALFRASGGTALRYVPALNDAPAHVDLLASIARAALGASPA
ncbi:MAG TPA: ferrochelatase [Solimonas sp.]|nr:ferrochelatase [Solimonas sp.]